MKFIVKPFSEILIKSKPVRKKYLSFLQTNCNLAFKKIDSSIKAKFFRDRQEIIVGSELTTFQYKSLITTLSRMPGIESFLEVIEEDFDSINDIFEKASNFYQSDIENKSFVVRVRRNGNHSFSSIDAEKYIGGGLLQRAKNAKVKLKNPDITINIEIKEDKVYLVKNKFVGIGGYPVGTQDKVISLISGGFDSGVSTYSMIKRGCKVDYLFFNLGGIAHETGVKQVANYIWKNFSSGYKAKFITINFEEVISHIVKDLDHKYRGIILKRLFLMVADILSKENEYYAIIKGDSLGQVSSQTLKNMFVIDKAAETLVLRPLISFNKQEIIDQSMKIGTYEFACNMPEYCAVISDKPATGAKLEKVLNEEKKFDFSLLEKAINNKKIQFIDEVLEVEKSGDLEIETSHIIGSNEVVIDVREEQKSQENPLIIEGFDILKIPFFDLEFEFGKLDQTKTYLFYCNKGMISKNQAILLKSKGFNNIKIFKPILDDSGCRIKTGK
ncbi:MAG: tRNA 4-thiouridine(8) synthase ThiI [Candidatus Gracilibacteria bacterium]|nr:tRNA 4-thiouridine(8) synthase ThiI [Candidatus Gracilibacteria bacterium]